MENMTREEIEHQIQDIKAAIEYLEKTGLENHENEITELKYQLGILERDLSESERYGDMALEEEIPVEETKEVEESETIQEQGEKIETPQESGESPAEVANSDEIEVEDIDGKYPMRAWLRYSGLDVLVNPNVFPEGELTEEEFIQAMYEIRAPKLIKEPGKAASFLNERDEWNMVKTTKEELIEARDNGNIPADVYQESYVLVEKYDGKQIEVSDRNGDSYLGKEEINAQLNVDNPRKAMMEAIPPEVLEEYRLAKAEAELAQNRADRAATGALVASALGNNTVAGRYAISSVANQIKADERDFESGKLASEIENEYGVDPEEIDDLEGEIMRDPKNYM